MTELKLFLFGPPRFVCDNNTIELSLRKDIALFIYLVVTRQPYSRDTLATLFWPESDQRSARGNLRRALYRLNRHVGEDVLAVTSNVVELAPDADVWVDIEEYQEHVAACLPDRRPNPSLDDECLARLTAAVDLYSDDFLAGFTLSDSPEFDEWQFFQSESLRASLVSVLEQLLYVHQFAGAFDRAIRYGRRWLALDPLHEPAHRHLMRLYAWAGQHAAALRQYGECARILDEEFGVPPEDETTAVYESIRTKELEPPTEVRADVPAAVTPPAPDERYVKEELLARGGHGDVYCGHDRITGQPVAIKHLRSELVTANPEFVARFRREGEALRRLNHPNIVRILATIEDDDQYEIVMDYVPGDTLRDVVSRESQLPLDRVLTIGLELADALSRAHHLGIVHRDIKPGNVLLAEDGTPRLTDFGVARLERDDVNLTQAGATLGSPAYMSPEALRGQTVDASSDVWSFGVLLYEMLAGRRPFEGEQVTPVVVSILEDPIPEIRQFRPDVPPALTDLLQLMLTRDRSRRIASMRQVAATLEAIRAGHTDAGSPDEDDIPAPVSPRAAEQRIRMITSRDGVRIAYATTGSGPVLVKTANWLSHLEYDWNSPVWRHWITAFSKHHTLVRYDKRGCGLSDWDVEDFSLDAQLQDLEAVVEAVGAERFPLMALSGGGSIAIAYAVRHPERVSHLILLGCYARGRFRRSNSRQDREQAEILLKLMEVGWGQDNPAFRHVYTSLFLPEGTAEQVQWFNELQRISTSPDAAVRMSRVSYSVDIRELAARVTVPTLVLHARDDAVCPFDQGRQLVAAIPNARFVPLDSKNHILLETEPAWQQFLDTVYQFLEEQPSDSGQDRVGGGNDQAGVETDSRYDTRDMTPQLLQALPAAVGVEADTFAGGPAVGRDTELATLRRALEGAMAGSRQIVFVTGEAGAGKTTLVEGFLADAADEGPLWIGHGQCLEHLGGGEAYLPILEALGRMCRAPGGDRLIALLARRAPTWLIQMPWLVDDAELDALQRRVVGATRERMLREMVELLDVLTADRLLVLVLEDLHWSDYSTLDLLDRIARRREPARLLVIGTYRPSDVRMRDHPLRGVVRELHVHRLCTELPLVPFSEDVVVAYLASRCPGSEEHAGLASLLHRHTGGNPLYVRSLVDAWIAQGALRATNGRWSLEVAPDDLDVQVPETLLRLIEQQLHQFESEDRDILEAASVVGMEFSAAAVAAALGETDDIVERRCTTLARHGWFLVERGVAEWADGTIAARFGFIHHVYQQALYDRVPAGRRVRLHRAIGTRLEAGYASRAHERAASLAVHFVRGRVPAKAVQYLQSAAQHGLQRSAHREAIEYLREGLAIVETYPDLPDRAHYELMLQSALAPALIATRGWSAPEAEQAYIRGRELSERLADTRQLSSIMYGLATLYELRGEYTRSQALLEERFRLLQKMEAEEGLIEGHELLACSTFHQGSFDDALDHAEHGLELYDPQRHLALTAFIGENPGVSCYHWSALALWFLGYPNRALDRIQKALALAKDVAHSFSLAHAHEQATYLHQFRRELDAVLEHADATITLATEQGYPYRIGTGTILRGWAVAVQGMHEEGIAAIQEGLSLCEATGAKIEHPYFLALLADAYRRAGRVEEGRDAVAEALAMVRNSRAFFYEAEILRLQGALRLRAGGSDAVADAERSFLQALELARQQKAKFLELRALVSLYRLWDAHERSDDLRAGREMLANAYDWFTEGFDTLDLQEAGAILREDGADVVR